MHKLTMTDCICLGDITGYSVRGKNKPFDSICGECGYPMRKCTWLTRSRPYPGTEYYRFTAYEHEAYIVTSCPHYIPPEADE